MFGKNDKEKSVMMNVDINVVDLVCHLIENFTPDEMIEFIKEIDYEMQDWYFTEEMFLYFDDVMKEHPDNEL